MVAIGMALSRSGNPCENANPADVVASALNPRYCRYTAEPMSHGFGRTKHPDSCSLRNAATGCAICIFARPVVSRSSTSIQLDLNVDACGELELHERVDGFVRGIQDVHETLVSAQLELVARVFVTMRRDQ